MVYRALEVLRGRGEEQRAGVHAALELRLHQELAQAPRARRVCTLALSSAVWETDSMCNKIEGCHACPSAPPSACLLPHILVCFNKSNSTFPHSTAWG